MPSGAPTDASYVLITGNAALSAYRQLVAGNGLDLTDGGALGNVTLTVDESELDHALLGDLAANSHPQYILGSVLSVNGQLLGRAAGSPAPVSAPASGQLLGYAGGLWAPVTPGQRGFTLPLKVTPTQAGTTIIVSSTTYQAVPPLGFVVDLDTMPFTDFRVLVSGSSTTGGQTITCLLATVGAPSTAISTGDTGLVITSTGALWDSGWKSRNDGSTGVKEYQLSMKGSNGSVNLNYGYIQLLFRWNLPLP